MFYLPNLPYTYTALEPFYDAQTLKIHHDILHKGYVDNLNATEEKLSFARKNNNFENIRALEKDLSFYGSGHILHTLFWDNMTPSAQTRISDKLTGQIIRDFGGLNEFKKQFEAAALNIEGGGWCILGYVSSFQKLEILQCEKHQNLTLWGIVPLLVFDMWEHSYFLQYKTAKVKYMNAWWNIVNWDVVSKRFDII